MSLLCLVFLTQHNTFKAYLCCSMYQYFILFCCWIFHFVDYFIYIFTLLFIIFYLFIIWWALVIASFGYYEWCCYENLCVGFLCVGHMFSFLLSLYLGIELLGHKVTLCYSFEKLENCFPILHSTSSVGGIQFLHSTLIIICLVLAILACIR